MKNIKPKVLIQIIAEHPVQYGWSRYPDNFFVAVYSYVK